MRRGLTLIELILVVAVMTTVGILSAPVYSRFLTQNAVEEAATIVSQNLRKAQWYALMSRKSSVSGWGVYYLDNPAQEMVLYQGTSFAARNSALDEKTKLPGRIGVTNFEVNFTRVTGIPGGLPTIIISGQGNTRSISINGMGVVSVAKI